ncbi:MAG: high-potential iron-sulfur protein [Acidiferrobacterales bacterium]|nr:high-potential iron-sulfur protein [Acidiferrobacterales bacterium]
MNSEQTVNRRKFVKLTLGSAIAAPLLAGRLAQAGGHLPKLEESDPQAVALKYKHDAAAVDADNFKAGSNCANCSLFQGKEGNEWGPCGIFPGKEVAAAGWCSAYNPKA